MYEELMKKLSEEIAQLAKNYKTNAQERVDFIKSNTISLQLDLDNLPAINIEEKKEIHTNKPVQNNVAINTISKHSNTNSNTENTVKNTIKQTTQNNSKKTIIDKGYKAHPVVYKATKFTTDILNDSVGLAPSSNKPEDVLLVRKLLNKRGYKVAECDTCDNELIEQIKKFQKDFNLKVDGVVGPYHNTIYALSKGKRASTEYEITYFRLDGIEHVINEVATQYNIEPNLMKAICYHESRGEHKKGLMQVMPTSWNEIIKQVPELAKYPYNPYHRDPQIHLIFSAVVLDTIKRSVSADFKMDASHEKYEFMTLMYYNAGSGTMTNAINRAKNAGSTNPYEDCMKAEFMKPAIKSCINNMNTQEDIEKKYKEISEYYDKVSATANEMRAKNPSYIPPKNTDTNSNTKTTENSNKNSVFSSLDIPRLQKAFMSGIIEIKGSVGQGGQNETNDVLVVKIALHKKGFLSFNISNVNELIHDYMNYNKVDSKTLEAIINFQSKVVGAKNPDGRIDVNGQTIIKLNNSINKQTNSTTESQNTIENPKVKTTISIDKQQLQAAIKNDNPFIRQPVGRNQTNNPNDVLAIKILLSKIGLLHISLNMFDTKNITKDAFLVDNKTIEAIEQFQREKVGRKVDGFINPNGPTFNALVNGRVVPEKAIIMTPKLVFVGDSIAVGFHTASEGEKIARIGADPKAVLGFLQEAIDKYDLKNKILCLSTGYSNDIKELYQSQLKSQFDLIKKYGIKAKVFGVSLNYPDNKGQERNNNLAALCKSVGADFIGGFKASAGDGFIHPSYYRIK